MSSGQIIIAGAASGIGEATAAMLQAQGAELSLLDRDGARLAEVAGGLGIIHRAVTVDVTDDSALNKAIDGLADTAPICGLVNAAGVLQLGDIADVSPADWDRVVDINLKGTYLACRAVIPRLRASSIGGAIVNISSVSGRTKSIFSAPNYVASKAGVIGLTMALAAQHARDGIRVNCVAPGIVETPMLDRYSDAQRAAMARAVPMGRFAAAEEIAQVIAFMLSDQASYVTGQTINVNGGQFMQ